MAKYRGKASGLVVDAQQFNCQDHATDPAGFRFWPDDQGLQPRDASWGFVRLASGERAHVFHNDYVVTLDGVHQTVLKPDVFERLYTPEGSP